MPGVFTGILKSPETFAVGGVEAINENLAALPMGEYESVPSDGWAGVAFTSFHFPDDSWPAYRPGLEKVGFVTVAVALRPQKAGPVLGDRLGVEFFGRVDESQPGIGFRFGRVDLCQFDGRRRLWIFELGRGLRLRAGCSACNYDGAGG